MILIEVDFGDFFGLLGFMEKRAPWRWGVENGIFDNGERRMVGAFQKWNAVLRWIIRCATILIKRENRKEYKIVGGVQNNVILKVFSRWQPEG